MTKYREILRLHGQGISKNSISKCCECSRNTVISVISRAMDLRIVWPLESKFTDEFLRKTLFPDVVKESIRKMPDYDYVHKEMAKSGVTLSLLWNEYCEICRLNNDVPFMYTQFCKYYQDFTNTQKATMHIDRKPGEALEVDWAGQTAEIINDDTGEIIPAYIFVAALPSSGYAFVEAFTSQNQENWISAHTKAFSFFGGVTRILVPDNLKTGVDKASWFSPVINKTYQEMAEHYGTVVIPARVRKPKDKPTVEGTVKIVSTWILAAIRNFKFFSLAELNEAIHEKLFEFNRKSFQKKPGSRLSTFMEEERQYLLPLTKEAFELALWKVATVAFNYCIQVEKNFYSVPYEYIKHKVDVRITSKVVEVFFEGNRICSHPRLLGRAGQYSMVSDHMPPDHRKYSEWNAERFISWAEKIGPSATIVVRCILTSSPIEQRGYRTCMALLKLSDKYSVTRLESACKRALTYTPRPSFKSIQTILSTGQDKIIQEDVKALKQSNDYAFTRGSNYYGRDEEC